MSQAEELQLLLPSSQVVKAFNVLSAYALSRGDMASKEIPVCSDSVGAREVVCGMASDLHFTPVNMGSLVHARELEQLPLRFFPGWSSAFLTSIIIWMVAFIILIFQWQICPNLNQTTPDWSSLGSLPTSNVSIACGDTALTLLALCYFPGVIAAYLQLFRGTKYSEFPRWLDRWLKDRKQLGLLMLFNACLHVVFKLAGSPLSGSSSWRWHIFIATGGFALLAATLLGIASLPSVANTMTWREFAFVQSKLGWFTLLMGTMHLIFAEWKNLFKPTFVCYLPSNAQFVMVIPMVTLVLKLPLLLPCINARLTDIRQGYEKTPCCCMSRDDATADQSASWSTGT